MRGAHVDPASVAKTGPHSGSAGYDVRGISISQQAPLALARCESKTYKVELTANITVSISSYTPQVTASPSSLTFTTSGWNTARTVALASKSLSGRAYSLGTVIRHTSSSADPDYNRISADSVDVLSRPLALAVATPDSVDEVTLSGSGGAGLADPWTSCRTTPSTCTDADRGLPLSFRRDRLR